LKKSKKNKWDSEDNNSDEASDQEMESEEDARNQISTKKETMYEEE
jgi:hypothetical protein